MPTVLCADDAVDIRRLLQQVLSRDGLNVVLAGNGAEALELMIQSPPDGVLLDINMPVIDGLEVLRRMAGDPRLAALPVMMLTANSQAENVREALANGARDFVVKPFEPAALRQRVRRLLSAPTAVEGPARARGAAAPVTGIAPVVLVADDQPPVLQLAGDLLGSRFEVLVARTGAGALAQAIERRPAVVLLDLAMPIMDGAEACRRIRERPELAATKILAMRLGDEGDVAGFDGMVRKPLERVDLTRAVCRALGVSGLFAFVGTGDVVALRFFEARCWDPAQASSFWEARDLEALRDETERVFGRMIESGYRQVVIDLTRIGAPPERHVGALVTAVRQVAARIEQCRLVGAVVAPFNLQRQFDGLRGEFGVLVTWRMPEALGALRRRLA